MSYAKAGEVPSKDWRILRVIDKGVGVYYRYHVEGENLNYTSDDSNFHFRWNVRDLDDPRYDLSSAVFEKRS